MQMRLEVGEPQHSRPYPVQPDVSRSATVRQTKQFLAGANRCPDQTGGSTAVGLVRLRRYQYDCNDDARQPSAGRIVIATDRRHSAVGRDGWPVGTVHG